MTPPEKVVETHLWKVLSRHANHASAISQIRSTAEGIGRQVERLLPDFTDHSVRHMDSLWEVADAVLTADEFEKFTASEAFVLAASFYIHDLGMAVAATSEGADSLRRTKEYRIAHGRASAAGMTEPSMADHAALSEAARRLHADNAKEIAVKEFCGTGRYLIEDSELRESYGQWVGEVSASHHWPLEEVHRALGGGATPFRRGFVITLTLDTWRAS